MRGRRLMIDLPIYDLKSVEDKGATIGIITDSMGKKICHTLEPAWNDNKPGLSCIPAGTYKCVFHHGKYYQSVWKVLGVPGREDEDILIHNGNFITDTKGSILVGNKHTEYNGMPMVNDTVNTLNKMRASLPKEFYLQVSSHLFINQPDCQNVLNEKNSQRLQELA